jgi:hypothetical protein
LSRRDRLRVGDTGGDTRATRGNTMRGTRGNTTRTTRGNTTMTTRGNTTRTTRRNTTRRQGAMRRVAKGRAGGIHVKKKGSSLHS